MISEDISASWEMRMDYLCHFSLKCKDVWKNLLQNTSNILEGEPSKWKLL